MKVLIAGCGYFGLALGRHLVGLGHEVTGLRRSAAAAPSLSQAGLQPLIADLSQPASLPRPGAGWDWVVFCPAPSESGPDAYRTTYLDGAKHLLAWLSPRRPRALVFTSSTSVYPQADGSVVDESTDANPAQPTAQLLRAAEDCFLAAVPEGFPCRILRVTGIYGPGRHRLEDARQGALPAAEAGRWMNFIHRDDLVTAVVAALERGRDGRIYNVTDGHPATAKDFVEWLYARVGAAPATAGGAPRRTARAVTSKRIDGRRLREELGWQPRYPDFRAGYEALLALEERANPDAEGGGD